MSRSHYTHFICLTQLFLRLLYFVDLANIYHYVFLLSDTDADPIVFAAHEYKLSVIPFFSSDLLSLLSSVSSESDSELSSVFRRLYVSGYFVRLGAPCYSFGLFFCLPDFLLYRTVSNFPCLDALISISGMFKANLTHQIYYSALRSSSSVW